MIQSIREEIKAVLEGIGYNVSDYEITSSNQIKAWISQYKSAQYPIANIIFGNATDDDYNSPTGLVGYIKITEDLQINTVYYERREGLLPVRDEEERKIRDAIADYNSSNTKSACKWYVESIRPAFLPGVKGNDKPVGGLAIKTKIQYRIKERS